MQFKIKTHVLNRSYPGNYFFILSKGNNAGKPMENPCPNCFVVLTPSSGERHLLYWLCFGLWQGKYFYRHLVGSVIPFLRLPDIKAIIFESLIKVEPDKSNFEKAIGTLNQLLALEQNLSKQLHLANQAKKTVIRKFMT